MHTFLLVLKIAGIGLGLVAALIVAAFVIMFALATRNGGNPFR